MPGTNLKWAILFLYNFFDSAQLVYALDAFPAAHFMLEFYKSCIRLMSRKCTIRCCVERTSDQRLITSRLSSTSFCLSANHYSDQLFVFRLYCPKVLQKWSLSHVRLLEIELKLGDSLCIVTISYLRSRDQILLLLLLLLLSFFLEFLAETAVRRRQVFW